MPGMILFSGMDAHSRQLQGLNEKFSMRQVDSAEQAAGQELVKQADAFLIGPGTPNPSRQVQKIFAADKHLAIVVLTEPADFKQVKQVIQFSAFVGNNTLVVPLSPELNIVTICENAVTRTKQKRNFQKLNIGARDLMDHGKKARLGQMGTFLEYAPMAAVLLNEENRIVNFNRQAKNYFPPLEFLDMDLSSIFAAKDAEKITSFIRDGHNPEVYTELQQNNRVLQLTTSEVYDEEGSRHFLLLFNDVTGHRLEMKRIEAILESIPQMAWTTDASGSATYFTQGWYFYTGQKREEAIGTGWVSVVYEDDKDRLAKNWEVALKTGKPFQQAARYRNTKNEYRWHLARASAIRDTNGRIIMWVGTCTDIHDQVLLTEELERKVKERTKSLEITNSELEQFAHVSSHDLQEPLRKIRTFAELLKDGVYDKLDSDSKRYIDKINDTAERMSNSLKALLNYTRLRKEEKFITVDLNEIVSQVLVDLELMISQKGAKVTIQPLPVITASPIQMQQLFYNLLNNALKFSRKDVPPEIQISARQLMEEELIRFPQLQHFREYHEISVQDNGIGFDEQYAGKIFTIFQRLHSKAAYEGTGIGLSLVKKVVLNHGGDVYVKSQPEKGTAFFVILPA